MEESNGEPAPLAADDAKPTLGPAMTGRDRTISVLVIDDDANIRTIIEFVLRRGNFQVHLAENGQQGLELYQAHQASVDIVLLDVHMPVLDGAATFDRLRTINPAVVVCFMSGDFDPYRREDLRRRGASLFLEKPLVLGELAGLLDAWIRRGTTPGQ